MDALVVVGDEGEAERFAFDEVLLAFGAGQADMDPVLGHAEFLTGEGADEFVGAAAGGIGHAVARAVGEGFAGWDPLAPGGAVEVFEDLVGGAEGKFHFAGLAGDGSDEAMGGADFGGALGRVDDGFAHGCGVHDTGHAVVVGGGDGIEFVIVAAGAGDGEAEEGFADDVELVVDGVRFGFDGVGGAVEDFAEPEEVGAEGGFEFGAVLGEAGVGEKVAGDVFADEGVVGDVFVEGAGDVVAILPGVEFVVVVLVAVGFGEADEIEPVPSPAFAVVGRGKEAIDDFGVGLRSLVDFEGVDFGGGGREADEIKGNATEPGATGGFRGGGEGLLFELGQDIGIDRGAGPAGVFDDGRRVGGEGLEGPVFAAAIEIDSGGGFAGGGGGVFARVGRAHADPGFEIGNDGVGQFAGGRHAEVEIGVGDGFPEAAFVGLAGDDDGAGVAALAERGAGIEL